MEKETQKEKWTRGDYLEFSKSSNITFEKMRICQKLGTICFYYSVDGKSNEEDFFFTSLDFGVCILKRWVHILQQHSCEICSPSLSVRVKEREKIQNGNEKKKEKEKEKESVCLVTGFFELCVGLGICIIGWLFLYRPRQYIILQTNNLLNDWQIQMNGGKVWSSLWRKKTISRVPSLARFWEWTLRGSLLEFLWANRLTFLPVVIPFDVSLGLERGEGEGERERERGRERRERREEKEEKEDVDPQLEKKNKKEIIQHHQTNKERENPLSRKVMVPIGGGKDALTLVELLRNCLSFPSHQIVLFYLDDDINEWEMNWRVRRLLKATGVLQCVRVHLSTPQQQGAEEEEEEYDSLFEDSEYEPAAPPWAALISFAATFAAIATNCQYISVGNERSANYGNGIMWLNNEVNHQFDKSFFWEKESNRYIQKYIAPQIWYFSGLMHLWEVQIAEKFCEKKSAERYLSLFLSCNQPQESGFRSRWCGKCAKCAFVFLLLSGFLSLEECWGVFGDNLFEHQPLLPIFRSLLGLKEDPKKSSSSSSITPPNSSSSSSSSPPPKPLECVGTARESRVALYLTIQKYSLKREKKERKKEKEMEEEKEKLLQSLLINDPEILIQEEVEEEIVTGRFHQEEEERSFYLPYILRKTWSELSPEEREESKKDVFPLLRDFNNENLIPEWFWGQ